jgi:hypothetical protein
MSILLRWHRDRFCETGCRPAPVLGRRQERAMPTLCHRSVGFVLIYATQLHRPLRETSPSLGS